MFVQLQKSNNEGKKFTAIFYDNERKKVKTTHFGATGYTDYTLTGDDEKKELYLLRHGKENWNDPTAPATLARYVLWNYKSLSKSYNDYLKRFGLKKY
jgi:hypothetical protein